MSSLFFAFPGGWPAVALLLLRAVFGLTLVAEGRSWISEANATPGTWFIGLSAVAAGGLLLIGFLTPIVGALVAAGVIGAAFSLLPAFTRSFFDSGTSLLFGLTMLIAIIGLGPGAFSMDARVFGRREIILPPPISSSHR